MKPKTYTEAELRRLGFIPTKKYETLSAKAKKLEADLAKAKTALQAFPRVGHTPPHTLSETEYQRLPKNLQYMYALDDNCLEALEIKVYDLMDPERYLTNP
jgi:hypothetical protein